MNDPAETDLKKRREADAMRLALVRTELANRRTFLAYIKTALGTLAGGLALIHLVEESPTMLALGWFLMPVTVVVLGLGIRDYLVTKERIQANKTDSRV